MPQPPLLRGLSREPRTPSGNVPRRVAWEANDDKVYKSRSSGIRPSESAMGSEDKRPSKLRLSSYRRIMPVHMDQTTSQTRPKRKASIEDLEELGRRATEVIEEARRISLAPDNKKKLRTFTMSEVCKLLELHPTAYYELIRTNPEFEGSKVDRQRLFSLADIHRLQAHLKLLPRQRYGIERAIAMSVANFKGGVAKTFTAVTLAQYMAMRGYRTLVIDTDPQASMTSSFGINSSDVNDWNTILPYLYGKAEVEWGMSGLPRSNRPFSLLTGRASISWRRT